MLVISTACNTSSSFTLPSHMKTKTQISDPEHGRRGRPPDSTPATNSAGPDFDDDIITEILLRVPAKSLIRFRCVCKSWRALISDPYFVQNHLRRVNPSHFNLLLVISPFQADVLKLDDGEVAITEHAYPPVMSDESLDEFSFPGIYGSCNGLVCLEYVDVEGGNIIILWNPCIREFKQLPEPENNSIYGCESLALFSGFGYDSTIEDYKVMRAMKAYDEPTTLQIFTLKTSSWRYISDFNHFWFSQGSEFSFPLQSSGFLLKETLHWVAIIRDAEGEEGTLGLLSFSLSEEKFRMMAALPFRRPSRYSHPISDSITSMVMVGNSLLVYHEFSIWMTKEYGVEESWTQVINISPEGLPQHAVNMWRTLCVLENGEVLLCNEGEALGLYNLEEKTFRSIIWNCDECFHYTQYVTYVETLVSPVTGESERARTYLVDMDDPLFDQRLKDLRSDINRGANRGFPPGWSKKGRRRKRQRPMPVA